MQVKELIDALSNYPPELEIIVLTTNKQPQILSDVRPHQTPHRKFVVLAGPEVWALPYIDPPTQHG